MSIRNYIDEKGETKLEIQNYKDSKQYGEEILEKNLPSYLENDLNKLKEGIKNSVIIYIKNILEWRNKMINFTNCKRFG